MASFYYVAWTRIVRPSLSAILEDSMHTRGGDTRRTSGFTIVELLIVIVVIAILATITIVAYNGVQQRANNTARIAAAKQAITTLTLYMAENNAYPLTVGTGRCLGTGFPGNACWGVDSPSPAVTTPSLLDSLSEIGSLPHVSYPTVDMGYWHGIGPVYHYNTNRTVDGVPNPVVVVYFLDGSNQDCGLPNIVRNTNDGTPGTVENSTTYATVTTSPRNTASTTHGTYCIAAIPPIS